MTSQRFNLKCAIVAAAVALSTGCCMAQNAPIKIGVLTDMSSAYADGTGQGSVEAAHLAIEDAGDILNHPVELVVADHQNKPDLGSSIARQWYERDGVDMITDVPGSSVGFAVQTMSAQFKKPVLFIGATSSDLTGVKCTPYSAMWGMDTYTLSKILGTYITRHGLDSWYFIALDLAVGRTFVSDASKFIVADGGKVLGASYVPINTPDFSSFLLQAQASKAKVIALANAGADPITAIKQGGEFGIPEGGQTFAAFLILEPYLKSLGLKAAHGLLVPSPFFWNLNDDTRAFSRRFEARMGRPPSWNQALVYSTVTHYLAAVKAAGTRDPDAVMAKMRELPVNDLIIKNGHLRIDGRLVADGYLFEAKKPSEAANDWDLYKIVQKIPGEEATRPLAEGGCPLVK